MRTILFSILLSLLIVSDIQGMDALKDLAVFESYLLAGSFAGAGAGAFAGPAGVLPGAIVGGAIGGVKGLRATDSDLVKKRKEAERLRREHYINYRRITDCIFASGEADDYHVTALECADFVKFENGNGPLVIARRAFADRQMEELSQLQGRINQKLLDVRKKLGRPIDWDTGNYVELNAKKLQGKRAIDYPSADSIKKERIIFEGPENHELFRDIEKLFIAGNIFWLQKNIPIETLKTVMAHVRWATLNAYALPLIEKLDAEQAQHQQKIRENTALLGAKQQVEKERNQERIRREKCERDILGVEEMLPMIQRNTRQLEQESAHMREELARRRAESPIRRQQLQSQAAEIEKLKRDLAAARDAFASCTLTNP